MNSPEELQQTISEKVADNKYEVLWTSLRMGCNQILTANPNNASAKATLAHMDLTEAILNAGQPLLDALSKIKDANKIDG